jgi:hypothetical protein
MMWTHHKPTYGILFELLVSTVHTEAAGMCRFGGQSRGIVYNEFPSNVL